MDLAPATPSSLLGRVAAALPDFGFAAVFVITWVEPTALAERMVAYLLLVMLIEFLVVHASGFMGMTLLGDTTRTTKIRALAGLGVFYLLFAAAFGWGFGAWWPVAAIAGMTLNRMLSALFDPAPTQAQQQAAMSGWVVGVLAYVLGAFLTTLAPMPAFGLTPDAIRALDLPGGGLWVEEPYRVLAFGAFYFAATGLSELVGQRWLPVSPPPSWQTR